MAQTGRAPRETLNLAGLFLFPGLSRSLPFVVLGISHVTRVPTMILGRSSFGGVLGFAGVAGFFCP